MSDVHLSHLQMVISSSKTLHRRGDGGFPATVAGGEAGVLPRPPSASTAVMAV